MAGGIVMLEGHMGMREEDVFFVMHSVEIGLSLLSLQAMML